MPVHSVPFGVVRALCETLDVDVNETAKIVVEPDGIQVTVHRLNEEGFRYAVGKEVATVTTTIAIDR